MSVKETCFLEVTLSSCFASTYLDEVDVVETEVGRRQHDLDGRDRSDTHDGGIAACRGPRESQGLGVHSTSSLNS